MFVTSEEREPLGGFFGFVLPMVVVGALAGFAYFLVYQISDVEVSAKSITKVAYRLDLIILGFLGSFLFLYRGNRIKDSLIAILCTSVYFGVLFFTVLPTGLNGAPNTILFWPILALAKAYIERPAKTSFPQYRDFFAAFITLPLLAAAVAAILVTLALLAGIMMEVVGKNLNLNLLIESIETNRFLLAGIGALAGVIFALVRQQRILIGAIRYGLLYAARFSLPIITVLGFCLAIFSTLTLAEGEVLVGLPISLDMMLFLLIVNHILVYQAGDAMPPSGWLRVAMIAAALVSVMLFALYINTNIGADILYAEVNPIKKWIWHIAGGLHVVVMVIGALTEIKWRKARWMPILSFAFYLLVWVWILALPVIGYLK